MVAAVGLGVIVFCVAGLAFAIGTADPRWLLFTLLLFVTGRCAPAGAASPPTVCTWSGARGRR
jgi:hypothetical protein